MNKSADFMRNDMSCDNGCVDNYMKYRRWTDFNEFDIMMRCPCNIPVSVNPVSDFEGSDFLKISSTEWATMLEDATPATPPANETNEEKIKRVAAETKAKATEAAKKAKAKLDEASGGNAMYIIGGVGVVCLGGIAYMCFSKKDESEEGGSDRYTSQLAPQ